MRNIGSRNPLSSAINHKSCTSTTMFSRLSKLHKELGTIDTLVHVSNKTLEGITRPNPLIWKYYITKQPVTNSPLILGKKGDIQIHECQKFAPECYELGRPNHIIDRRFEQGGRCFIARRKGEIAGYLWINVGKYIEDEVRCTYHLHPPENSAWDYDVFVFPKHRLSFTFPRLWEHVNQVLESQGITNSYSRVSYSNTNSLKSHKKLGSQIMGAIYFLNLRKLQIAVSLQFSPHIAISTKENSSPGFFIK